MNHNKKMVAFLTKSPHPKGRIGDSVSQDWWMQVLSVVEKYGNQSGVMFVVTSATHVKGAQPEVNYYLKPMNCFGLDLHTRCSGFETVEQLIELKKWREQENRDLVISCTWVHAPRVAWICKREKIPATLLISGGIPRPKEFITDCILTILYPIIDLLGLRNRFLQKIEERRKEGNL